MPKVVVRKGYRCQPGKRREVLTALQRMDAAAAEAGYPRGRYLFVETRAPGEPDLEVEFTFESYAEMEQLERRMRERVARYMRDGGSTGQEFLIEPSATRYLLALEDSVTAASTTPAATSASPPNRRPTAPPSPAQATPATRPSVTGTAGAASISAPRGTQSQGQRPSTSTQTAEPPAWMDEDEEDFDESDFPEPDVPPPPDIPPEMTPEQFRARQVAAARAALANAERTVNLQPRGAPGRGRNRPADQDQER